MNFVELQHATDEAMSGSLASAGFRHITAGTWNRRRDDELNVVQLQEHTAEKTFCVNLGIHYAFLPRAGTEALLDRMRVEVIDCELKLRLTEQAAAKDQWWPMSASSVDKVADLVRHRGLFIFDLYRIDGPISGMNGESVESENPDLLTSITKVRACLLLARMHEHLGNRDKSIEIATTGIKLAGMAVGPKKALKDILKRLGHLS